VLVGPLLDLFPSRFCSLGVVRVLAVFRCSHVGISARIRVKRASSPGFTRWAYLTSAFCFLGHYFFLVVPLPVAFLAGLPLIPLPVAFLAGRPALLPYVPFPIGIILSFYLICDEPK